MAGHARELGEVDEQAFQKGLFDKTQINSWYHVLYTQLEMIILLCIPVVLFFTKLIVVHSRIY